MVEFQKIKVDKPVVDMDGDEMTRIIWQLIKDKVNPVSNLTVDPSLPRSRNPILRSQHGKQR